jgi:hypothetical protein
MVMDPVPQSEWCTCNPKTAIDSKEYPPKNGEGKASSTGDYGSTESGKVVKLTGTGWWARYFMDAREELW